MCFFKNTLNFERKSKVIKYEKETIYNNKLIDYKKEGKGTSYFQDGSEYIGDFQDGLFHGIGTLLNSDGTRYEGEFKKGKMDGIGKFNSKNGNIYRGTWINGHMSEVTKYTLSGSIIEEKYVDGILISKKTLKSNKNSSINNTFKEEPQYKSELHCNKSPYMSTNPTNTNTNTNASNHKNSGTGTFYFKSGGKYVGEYKNKKAHGTGVISYPNGVKYEGEFCNGKIHGKGTLFNLEGDKYDGEWIENTMFNITKYCKNGSVVKDLYSNGKLTIEENITNSK